MRMFSAISNSIGAIFGTIETGAVGGEKLLSAKIDNSLYIQKIEHGEERIKAVRRFKDLATAEDIENIAEVDVLLDALFQTKPTTTKE